MGCKAIQNDDLLGTILPDFAKFDDNNAIYDSKIVIIIIKFKKVFRYTIESSDN